MTWGEIFERVGGGSSSIFKVGAWIICESECRLRPSEVGSGESPDPSSQGTMEDLRLFLFLASGASWRVCEVKQCVLYSLPQYFVLDRTSFSSLKLVETSTHWRWHWPSKHFSGIASCYWKPRHYILSSNLVSLVSNSSFTSAPSHTSLRAVVAQLQNYKYL